MAADLNRVSIVGRLTRDPEIRHTAAGDPVANIRLAFSSRRRDSAGNWADQSNYIDVVVFGAQAKNAEQYLSKGRRVGIDGRLSWREWTNNDGTKRQNIEIITDNLFFLDSNPNGTAAQEAAPADDLAPVGAAAPAGSPGPDDDVPF